MTLESLGWIVFLLVVIGLGCYWIDVQEQRERNDAPDWRSDGDRALDRRRAELDAASRERFG